MMSNLNMKKGNVANQREHLIMLLANIDVRGRNLEDYTSVMNCQKVMLFHFKCHYRWKADRSFLQLHIETIQWLMDKIFKNYRSWCNYLHCKSNLR